VDNKIKTAHKTTGEIVLYKFFIDIFFGFREDIEFQFNVWKRIVKINKYSWKNQIFMPERAIIFSTGEFIQSPHIPVKFFGQTDNKHGWIRLF
jgi:hypothetical protein